MAEDFSLLQMLAQRSLSGFVAKALQAVSAPSRCSVLPLIGICCLTGRAAYVGFVVEALLVGIILANWIIHAAAYPWIIQFIQFIAAAYLSH